MIQITKIDEATFDVTVNNRSTTTHRVTVLPNYAFRLTADKVNAETLLEKSFEFLLEREPNTSILRSFELSVIGRYFPEYEAEMKKAFS
jgi:hypothetical protein